MIKVNVCIYIYMHTHTYLSLSPIVLRRWALTEKTEVSSWRWVKLLLQACQYSCHGKIIWVNFQLFH